MKTNTNLTAALNVRKNYLNMMAQVETMRQQYRKMREKISAEENALVERMFQTAAAIYQDTGVAPTANEIAAALGGDMSRQEVVGQMMVAMCEHMNGASYPKPTINAKHKATGQRKGHVKGRKVNVTRRFAEVDKNGKLVEGGATMATHSWVNRYEVEG